jgi:hypothetical protein
MISNGECEYENYLMMLGTSQAHFKRPSFVLFYREFDRKLVKMKGIQ